MEQPNINSVYETLTTHFIFYKFAEDECPRVQREESDAGLSGDCIMLRLALYWCLLLALASAVKTESRDRTCCR